MFGRRSCGDALTISTSADLARRTGARRNPDPFRFLHSNSWITEDWRTIALAMAGVTLTPIAAVMAIWALILALGRVRLLAGHNVMARWHLSASAWQRFCALDQDRTAAGGLHNDFNAAKLSDDRGVDVIVGKKSALVGDSYHVLRRGGNPALHGITMIEADDPGCIEFAITYYRKNAPGSGWRCAFRSRPRRAATQPACSTISPRCWSSKPALALRHPGRTIGISLGVGGDIGSNCRLGLYPGQCRRRARPDHADGRNHRVDHRAGCAGPGAGDVPPRPAETARLIDDQQSPTSRARAAIPRSGLTTATKRANNGSASHSMVVLKPSAMMVT